MCIKITLSGKPAEIEQALVRIGSQFRLTSKSGLYHNDKSKQKGTYRQFLEVDL